jgi:hypothetical protein
MIITTLLLPLGHIPFTLAYLVSGLDESPTKGRLRLTSIIGWHGQGAMTWRTIQGLEGRNLVGLGLD